MSAIDTGWACPICGHPNDNAGEFAAKGFCQGSTCAWWRGWLVATLRAHKLPIDVAPDTLAGDLRRVAAEVAAMAAG